MENVCPNTLHHTSSDSAIKEEGSRMDKNDGRKKSHIPCTFHTRKDDIILGNGLNETDESKLKKVLHTLSNEDKYDIRILRLKNEGLPPFANTRMMDAVLDALEKCKTVQVLYIQNFLNGMLDPQMRRLVEVLKKGHIWGLNVGELTNVSKSMWEYFTAGKLDLNKISKFRFDFIHRVALPETNVTHMYASEGTVLSAELKTKMMDAIRENRKTDLRHYNASNREIIDRVSNMWFNPRSSNKYQAQFFYKANSHIQTYDIKLFTPGTVCWARVRGKKFWPCVVGDADDYPHLVAKVTHALVIFLNDEHGECAFVNGEYIQPWDFIRVSEKIYQRDKRYRLAVQQASLLYFARKQKLQVFSPWIDKWTSQCNRKLLPDLCLVDSLLPHCHHSFHPGSLVWHQRLPAEICSQSEIQRLISGGSKDDIMIWMVERFNQLDKKKWTLIQYFGSDKWALAKKSELQPLCNLDHGPTNSMLQQGGCQEAIEGVNQHIQETLSGIIKSEDTEIQKGTILAYARQFARRYGETGYEHRAKHVVKGLRMPNEVLAMKMRQEIWPEDSIEEDSELPPSLDPKYPKTCFISNKALISAMSLCSSEQNWEVATWDEKKEYCTFVYNFNCENKKNTVSSDVTQPKDELIAVCAKDVPFRAFLAGSTKGAFILESEAKNTYSCTQDSDFLSHIKVHSIEHPVLAETARFLFNKTKKSRILELQSLIQYYSKVKKEKKTARYQSLERLFDICEELRKREEELNTLAVKAEPIDNQLVFDKEKHLSRKIYNLCLDMSKLKDKECLTTSTLWRYLKHLGWKYLSNSGGLAIGSSMMYYSPNTDKSSAIFGVSMFDTLGILDYYWSSNELRQNVLEYVEQQIELEKKVFFEKSPVKSTDLEKPITKIKQIEVVSKPKKKAPKTKKKVSPRPRVRAARPSREKHVSKICARPGCNEVVAAEYCSTLCKRLHVGKIVKPQSERKKASVTEAEEVNNQLVFDKEKHFSKKIFKLYLDEERLKDNGMLTTSTLWRYLKQLGWKYKTNSIGVSMMYYSPNTDKDNAVLGVSKFDSKQILDYYWSDSKLRQTVLDYVKQQIEQGKKLFLENPVVSRREADSDSKAAKESNVKTEKNIKKYSNKRKMEIIDDIERPKPKKSKSRLLPRPRTRVPRPAREKQAKNRCARPGCNEIVAATYCSDPCRLKHTGKVINPKKEEEVAIFQNKTEKKEYIAKLYVADIKAMAGLFLTLSELQRWFITAAKNNLSRKENERNQMDWTEITSEPEIIRIKSMTK